MRTVVVAGGSGLVGARLLVHLSAHPEVSRIVAVVRRPLGVSLPKLEERVVTSFDEKALEDAMPKDVEDAYCALGTTIKVAGSQAAFRAVDHDAVLAFAKVARAHGARRFMLVSAQGASAGSINFYMRVKGEVEDALRGVGFDALHLLRPSLLDGERTESRTGERLALAVARVLRPIVAISISVDVVARAMVHLAFSDRFGVFVHAPREIASLVR